MIIDEDYKNVGVFMRSIFVTMNIDFAHLHKISTFRYSLFLTPQTLIKTKGVSKRNFFCFNSCKSVNTSLLGYPCVFCFLNVGDGQP